MTREFVIMLEFDRQWQKMGLGDNELRQLQETLLEIVQLEQGLKEQENKK